MAHRRYLITLLAALVLSGPGPSGARDGLLPREILALGGESRRHALLVDKEAEKLFLYEAQPGEPPRLVRAWNATTGQGQGDKRVSGDNRTPEGIYFFTEVLEDDALPPLYGVRALVLDYPNLFDRRHGKTGSGIWLHGTDELVRPLASNQTRGCVVLANRDVLEISRYVELQRTPIVVSDKVELVTARVWRAERNQLFDLVERWRRAWNGRDQETYGGFYADDFTSDGLDRAGWLRHKGEVAAASTELAVSVYQPTILRRGDEARVSFGQLYRSNLVSDYGEKTLWLEMQAGRWRIVAERWRQVEAPLALAKLLRPTPPAGPSSVAAGRDQPTSVAAAGRAVDAAGASAMMVASLAAVVPRDVPVPLSTPAPAATPPPRDDTPASVALSLPVAPPAATMALKNFLAESGPDEVEVSFELESLRPGHAVLRGEVVVVVRFTTAGGERYLAWPFGARLVAGRPVAPTRGDFYSIRRFKIVHATLPGVPRDARLSEVIVYVYDRAGREILVRSFGG